MRRLKMSLSLASVVRSGLLSSSRLQEVNNDKKLKTVSRQGGVIPKT